MKICPFCMREDLHENAKRCPHCGSWLTRSRRFVDGSLRMVAWLFMMMLFLALATCVLAG